MIVNLLLAVAACLLPLALIEIQARRARRNRNTQERP